MCKLMTSPDAFLIFSKLCFFQAVSGVKAQKMTQNDKILSVTLRISGTVPHVIVVFGTFM